jgi:protein-tyrosine phosphatase
MTGMVDLHSHHLPALDDGPRTLEESVRQVRMLAELGFRLLVTTPHVMQGMHEYPAAEIALRVSALQEAVGPEPRILPGAEHRFDELFLQSMEAGTLQPLGGRGRTVLVEFAWPRLPTNLHDMLFRIQLKGYQPVLAHPERYDTEEADFGRLRTWVERGGLLQVELGSLVGGYGGEARHACRRLLADGLVAVAAADVHAPEDVELHARRGLEALVKQVGPEAADQLCRSNPDRLLEEAK